MDMGRFAGSESKYMKSTDLPKGQAVKAIISGVAIVEFDKDDGSKETKPALSLQGQDKAVVCNPTTVMELGQAYGMDSDGWIGKEIGLAVKHYQSLGKDGIVVTAMKTYAENWGNEPEGDPRSDSDMR